MYRAVLSNTFLHKGLPAFLSMHDKTPLPPTRYSLSPTIVTVDRISPFVFSFHFNPPPTRSSAYTVLSRPAKYTTLSLITGDENIGCIVLNFHATVGAFSKSACCARDDTNGTRSK